MTNPFLVIIITILSGGIINPFHNTATKTHMVTEYVSVEKKKDDEPRPIRGTIRKPSFEVLPGASVELYTIGNAFVASVYSNSLGWYEFSPVFPGTYQIRVSADHYRDTSVNVTVTTLPVLQDIVMTDE